MHFRPGRTRLRRALPAACGVAALLASSALADSGSAAASPPDPGGAASGGGAVITLTTAEVGAPGNPSVAVVPFKDAVYRSCADAPAGSTGCLTVGGVGYPYGIGQLEVTVAQWVAFLNTADPTGRDPHDLYDETESSTAWPKYGQINFSAGAGNSSHYSVAYPEWADKPYGFANFLRSARFANSLSNGRVLSKQVTASGAYTYDTYQVRLSARTERGMYDLARPDATRAQDSGFVVPSQDEWIKAAYYDPHGGGTYSYWKYPTNPGVFGDGDATAPAPTVLNPTTGDVTNAATQPLASYHASGLPAPSWCPGEVQPADCATVNPLGLDPTTYAQLYQGSLSTVGQARTTSPWGTLDQGGNAVEWTDTITAPPAGQSSLRVWRRLHGGISNAPAFQMWPSAVGLQPQDNVFFNRTYPWLGIRIGVIGDPGHAKH
jgi:formylglycine-generating enzyme required for sulfatase activity